MSNHKNVIEINGRKYDAKTGALLSGVVVKPRVGSSIDGVVSAKRAPEPIKAPIQPVTVKATVPQKHQPSRAHVHQITPRKTQRSKTLMRRAVAKPKTSPKPAEIHTFKSSTVHNSRITRAQAVQKNPFIKKFDDSHRHHMVKKVAPLEVKEAPKAHTVSKSHAPQVAHKPVHHVKHTSQSEKLFSEALDKITVPTHTDKKSKKHAKKLGSRAVKWVSGGFAALLIVGFITYMSLPSLSVEFASARAGFNAGLPGYQPSGYKLSGPVAFEPGKITINFQSNTDERSYSVTQEVSQWNSEALQENFFAARNKRFETTQEAGRTIFLYDNGKASWVNGGVWYQIDSNSLSSEQLVRIASSL